MPEPAELERLERTVRALDERFRLPVIGVRVGWDAIVGLIPGVGDLFGVAAGLYPVAVAYRFGATGPILARMALNIGIDFIVGSIPIIGDVFDIGWKAHRKNYELLRRWVANPTTTQRASAGLLVTVFALVIAGAIAAGWATYKLIALLIAAAR